MNTKLVIPSCAAVGSAKYCFKISPAVKLPSNFWVPVKQKRQFSEHPIWLDTHRVLRSLSGIITAKAKNQEKKVHSTTRLSFTAIKYFSVPSREICLFSILPRSSTKVSLRSWRHSLLSDIASIQSLFSSKIELTKRLYVGDVHIDMHTGLHRLYNHVRS